ncbi:MAG: elongation factor G [Christensenellales bacterium]|jgi:elongation factor G
MKVYQASQIRNIGVVGHGSEGKTTLVEAMLFNAGEIDRMGKVVDGTTAMDYDPEEIKRTISISASMAPIPWQQSKLNMIDIPGYFDFEGEMVGGLKVADTALIAVGAVAGTHVGTEKAFDCATRYGLGKFFVVTQMDRENAHYGKVVEKLISMYGATVVPLNLPILKGEKFVGLVDVLTRAAHTFDGKACDVPDDLQDDLENYREALIEAAAENDEELLEKFFGGEALTEDEIARGVKAGLVSASLMPVACTAAEPNLGVKELMDLLVKYAASPVDKGGVEATDVKSGERVTLEPDADAPFAAQVFKTVADPFVGKLSLFRVYSGTLKSDSSIYNANLEKAAKPGTVYTMRGKKQIAAEAVCAGDIGALAKLTATATGHTLCDPAKPVLFDMIAFPEPCISMAVSAQNKQEEEKVFSGLARLTEEDPTFKVTKSEMGETIINGLGELHLEVIIKKLAAKFGVKVNVTAPIIPYRETIRKKVKAEGRHKKQTGGHGQFGHVWIEFEPIGDSGTDFEFVDKVVGGVVPRNFIPAVEKGLRENIVHGVLAGYPVVGLRCTLYDGSYHPVDSSEMAFKTAARLAYRKGLADAGPVLLEPIYHVKIQAPDKYTGAVIGDMNRRRGRVMGMNPMEDNWQEIEAEVPLGEMYKYATDLRAMTHARGTFNMAFERYEEVPAPAAAKIIENAKITVDEED